MPRPPDDYLWPFAGVKPIVVLTVAIVAVLALFNAFPAIDIAVSRMFFEEQPCPEGGTVCGVFPLAGSPTIGPIRQVLQATPVVLAALLLAVILWRLLASRSLAHPFDRAGLAAVAALLLGAGALVNMVLKEYWGRPRPAFTDLFGGPYPFVPAGRISDYCASNCSFVSGEAAGSFWLLALATLTPARFRVPALVATGVVAVATSLLRVGFGGHYLSDVILAGLLSLLVFAALATALRSFAGAAERATE